VEVTERRAATQVPAPPPSSPQIVIKVVAGVVPADDGR
jgi:hypothetical protein